MWGDKNPQLKMAFRYALSPLTQAINPVKKKAIVTDKVKGSHVRVHELLSTEKLSEIVAGYRKDKYTKAVVIVNTADSLMLEPAHLEGLESNSYPLLVVSQSDGQHLKRILGEQNEVLCDINVESTVDRPREMQVVAEESNTEARGCTAPQDHNSMLCLYNCLVFTIQPFFWYEQPASQTYVCLYLYRIWYASKYFQWW